VRKFVSFVLILIGASFLSGVAPSVGAQDLAVTVKDVQPFPYCAISHQGPYTDMAAVVGRLVGAVQTQGLFPQVRGPMIGVYFNSPAEAAPKDLVWQAGFIVTAQASPQPPLVKKVWEYRTVAVALHRGPYAEGGRTVAAMMAWLVANGYQPAGPVLERYLDRDPAGIRPEELRTEIWIPCIRRERMK
jgi:effector-binding domain-containing protein